MDGSSRPNPNPLRPMVIPVKATPQKDDGLKREDSELSLRDELLRTTKEHIDTARPPQGMLSMFR
jgi:hypothetical protein